MSCPPSLAVPQVWKGWLAPRLSREKEGDGPHYQETPRDESQEQQDPGFQLPD